MAIPIGEGSRFFAATTRLTAPELVKLAVPTVPTASIAAANLGSKTYLTDYGLGQTAEKAALTQILTASEAQPRIAGVPLGVAVLGGVAAGGAVLGGAYVAAPLLGIGSTSSIGGALASSPILKTAGQALTQAQQTNEAKEAEALIAFILLMLLIRGI